MDPSESRGHKKDKYFLLGIVIMYTIKVPVCHNLYHLC